MIINLYQSFYKKEQVKFLDPNCIQFDNTSNLTPDLREYPQMQEVSRHEFLFKQPADAYGLISWKFKEKAMIEPIRFIDHIKATPESDFWFVNPCPCLEAVCMNPWEQGEWWHKGITQLAIDTMERTFKDMGHSFGQWSPKRIYPRTKMFFANYFVARPQVWQRLFAYTDRFYATIERHDDLKQRMMAASGYHTDPGMSHFIFLFERLVPTFLMENPDIRTSKFEYQYDDVKHKFEYDEWSMIQSMSDMKNRVYTNQDSRIYGYYKDLILSFRLKYPNAINKE